MELITQILINISHFIEPHLLQLSTAIVATILVIYGDTINEAVRVIVEKNSFFIRNATFIVLCTFGYGAATLFLSPVLNKFLASLPTIYTPLAVLSIFIGIGYLAEEKCRSNQKTTNKRARA